MRNYVVVIERRHSFMVEVQANSKLGAEIQAHEVLRAGEASAYMTVDITKEINVIDEEELN